MATEIEESFEEHGTVIAFYIEDAMICFTILWNMNSGSDNSFEPFSEASPQFKISRHELCGGLADWGKS